jgi:hypothetical protein
LKTKLLSYEFPTISELLTYGRIRPADFITGQCRKKPTDFIAQVGFGSLRSYQRCKRMEQEKQMATQQTEECIKIKKG